MLAKTEEANEYRKNFDNYYKENLYIILQNIEKQRLFELKNVSLIITFLFLFLICGGLLNNYCLSNISNFANSLGCNLLMFVMAIIVIICSIISYKIIKGFENKIKKAIMPIFLKFFGDFEWSSKTFLDAQSIADSKLVNRFNMIIADDYFQGIYNNVKIIISEEKLKNSDTTAFEGIFIKLDMNKFFNSHTIIKENIIKPSIINNLPNNFVGLGQTKLEDPEFNKMFEVFTNNEVEARYIITTAFIERFKKLKKVFNATHIRASFLNHSLLIALSCNKDMFSIGNLLKPIMDNHQINVLFEEFLAIISIIDILNLNSKTGL